MNVVIYARFSCHSQNEQSIEGQLKTCYDFCERNGYKIVAEYIDRAISGTNADNRPEFQRMVADSAKRQFQAVVVYQLDRFARNRYDSATYKAKLKKHGVRVLSARENITDDASGVLMEAVLEGMAEYYSVELSQKIRRGMAINAEKCLCIGGGRSLGYDIDVDKKFVINKGEAAIVRQVFEMYLAGSTMAEIIRHLNAHGLKTAHGNPYNKNSIRKILTNRRYLGIYIYKDTEVPGGMPRIVDDATFNEAQILMEKNKKAPARAKAVEEFYLLTTKLYCDCGAAMTGVSGTARNGAIHQYYQCVTNRKHGDCKRKMVQKAYIEDLVIHETIQILTQENIERIAHSVVERCEKERNTDSLKRLQKLIRENETATENLVKALEAGKAADVISAHIEKRQCEKAELEAQLARERMTAPKLSFEQVRFFLERFTKGDAGDIQYRRVLVDTFISRIVLHDDRLVIYYNAQENINIPIDDGSPMGRLVEAAGVEPPDLPFVTVCIFSQTLIYQGFFRFAFRFLLYFLGTICAISPQIVPTQSPCLSGVAQQNGRLFRSSPVLFVYLASAHLSSHPVVILIPF